MTGQRRAAWETGCYLSGDVDDCGPCVDVVASGWSGMTRSSRRVAAWGDVLRSAGVPADWGVLGMTDPLVKRSLSDGLRKSSCSIVVRITFKV